MNVLHNRALLRWLGLMSIVAAALLLGGCTPSMEGESADVKYTWLRYRQDAKNDKKAHGDLPGVAKEIATERLAALQKRGVPKTLPPLRQYISDLERPIELNPAQAIGHSINLRKGAKQKALQWYGGKHLTLVGKDILPQWNDQIAQALQLDRQYEDQKRVALEAARQAASSNQYLESEKGFKEAIGLDSDDKPAAADYVRMQGAWLNYAYAQLHDRMTSQVMPRLRAWTVSFHQAGASSPVVVQKLVEDLDATRKTLVEFKAWAGTRDEFAAAMAAHTAEFKTMATDCAQLRGRAWKEDLWLLAQKEDYWAFYENARAYAVQDADGNKLKYAADELSILKAALQEGYIESLSKALDYYGVQAGRSKTQRLNGLALTNWRIACELLDFARQMGCISPSEALANRQPGCTIPPEAIEIGKNIDSAMKSVREQVRAGFARAVVIPVFDCRKNMDGDDVARKASSQLQSAFAGNSPRTSVGVSVRTVEEPGEAKEGDYRLFGKINSLFVDTLPIRETDRKEVQVGRKPTMSPNDDPRTKDEFPNKYSQEIWVYTKIVTKHAVNCKVAADFMMKRLGDERPLWKTDEVFGEEKPLAGCKLADTSVDWNFILVRKQESPRKSDMLDAEDLPKSTASSLHSDREVRERAIEFMCDQMTKALVPIVEAYPFDDLIERAKTASDANRPAEAADLAGLCLEYFCLISDAGNATGVPGNNWIAERTRMEKTLTEKVIPEWRKHEVPVPEKIGQTIWHQAVEQAGRGAVR